MVKIFLAILNVIVLMAAMDANAEELDQGDDSYIGFQISMPFGSSHKDSLFEKTEYSVILLNKRNGVNNGLVYTFDQIGNQSLNYMKPNQSLLFKNVNNPELYVPLFRADRNGDLGRSDLGGAEIIVSTVVVLVVMGGVIGDWFEDAGCCD